MNSDEGMYIAFWPTKLKKQLLELEELTITWRPPTLHGLNISAVVKLIAALLMLVVVIPGYIMPQVRASAPCVRFCSCFGSRLVFVLQSQILTEAGDALCGTSLAKQLAFQHLFAHA